MTAPSDHPMREAMLAALETRRSSAILALAEPGPDEAELKRLLAIAARVPDHGALTPWRFIVVRGNEREALSRQMIEALAVPLPLMPENERALAEQKIRKVFTIAPVIIVVVSKPAQGVSIPESEQLLSAGAVCMNLLVAAGAAGFGGNWITGWAAYHPVAHAALHVGAEESVAGIILLGTPNAVQPDRPRPDLDTIVTYWNAKQASTEFR